jgi:hypothetical protein
VQRAKPFAGVSPLISLIAAEGGAKIKRRKLEVDSYVVEET